MKQNRGITAGTVIMLTLTVMTIVGFAGVLSRLSGKGTDLSRLRAEALQLGTKTDLSAAEEIRISSADTSGTGSAGVPAWASTLQSTPAEKETAVKSQGITIVFGGTVAIEEAVRKSCYASESRKYDFSRVMSLLKDNFQGREAAVFLENVLMDDTKVSETVVPAVGAEMLQEAGVTLAAAGFSGAFGKGLEGIASTRQALSDSGVTPLGIRSVEGTRAGTMLRRDKMSVAVLQYTGTVSASTRKTMAGKNAAYAIPEAEAAQITRDIQQARSEGALAVVVMLNWGKTGGKNPDKAQKALAQQIAEAGADLIIGAGSRIPQAPEWLTVNSARGSRNVLCVYSLGTLVSDNRKAINRLSSYLLQVTFETDGQGGAAVSDTAYVPTYLWRYRQDGVYSYRCLAANRTPPDGMDSDQQKNMAKAAESIAELLENSGIRVLEQQ